MPGDAILGRGSSGAAVLLLQKLLNQLGAGLTEDGQFGARTEAALQRVMDSYFAVRAQSGDPLMMRERRDEAGGGSAPHAPSSGEPRIWEDVSGSFGWDSAAALAAMFQLSARGQAVSQGGRPPVIVGGWSDAPVDDPQIHAAAVQAVRLLQAATGDHTLALLAVRTARQQVVAGENFELELVVKSPAGPRAVSAVVFRDLHQALHLTSYNWGAVLLD